MAEHLLDLELFGSESDISSQITDFYYDGMVVVNLFIIASMLYIYMCKPEDHVILHLVNV